MSDSRPLQHVINFRDVGATINTYLGRKRIREGVIFRSARPDDASAEDAAIIRDEMGIATIIDLRTQTELIRQAEKLCPSTRDRALWSWFLPSPELPRIEGIRYENIKITGRPLERHLLRQLTWLTFIKVIFFFITGYRIDAVRLIATEAMLPRGLLGLGTDTIDHSGAEIRQTLAFFASAQSLPVLIHCTQGKDRTGLIIILVLMILDIPLDAIEHDYNLTDLALEAEREERLTEARQIGLTDDWVRTYPHMITGLKRHLEDKHGGLDSYLDGIGFDEAQRTSLRRLLLY